MKVDLFSIGSFTIHSYGLMIAIGIILAVFVGMHRAQKKGLDSEQILNMAIICVVIGFAGAKILFVLENFKDFIQTPLKVLGSSGFVVYGGLLIGLIAIIIYCKLKRFSFFSYADILFPSVALAQGFGRIGCFLAGCCYGKETTAWWGVTFPEGCFAPAGVSLIPTQLISSAGDFIIMAVLFALSNKVKKAGDVTGFYLLFYGIGRFSIEFLRTNTQGGFGPFTTAQMISFIFMAAGILVLVSRRISKTAYSYADSDLQEQEEQ